LVRHEVLDKILYDDDSGNYEDWIELYQSGTNWLDLTGFTLTDNLTNGNPLLAPLANYGGLTPSSHRLSRSC
jgi:hypothetical protein